MFESDLPEPMLVGEHLAMDFLNSVAGLPGERVEWLGNGPQFVSWLQQAGALEPGAVADLGLTKGAPQGMDSVAEEAREWREWLRGLVTRYAGRELGADTGAELAPLNRFLARESSYSQVEPVAASPESGSGSPGRVLRWRRVRRWTEPRDLLLPIAEAIGDLFCNADFRRVHTCGGQGCTLMFLDRSKAHSRRWCSMAVCGNRAKAAAHRARRSRREKG